MISRTHKIIQMELEQRLRQSGLMYRIFGRDKTVRSLKHKKEIKGEKYRSGKSKIQDMIGIRIVLYFSEDVEAVDMFLCCEGLIDRSVDTLNDSTFRPQRLNLVKEIPDELKDEFRKSLPKEYEPYIDDTYEIQIRTVFSEGWHEVEHDMRYKCLDDWEGCEGFSRQLNGVLATLETAQWTMSAIFSQMALQNMLMGNFDAMLRNILHMRLADDGFSEKVKDFLATHASLTRRLLMTDRLVFVLMLLKHRMALPLTHDNILFLVNRYDIMSQELRELEDKETTLLIDQFIANP